MDLIRDNKQQFTTFTFRIFSVVCVVWFLVHGFAVFSNFLVHDSITMYKIGEWNVHFLVSIGRYFESFFLFIKGGMNLPLEIALLSIFFIFISLHYLSKMFNIQSENYTYLLILILCSNTFVSGYFGIYKSVDSMYLSILFIIMSLFYTGKSSFYYLVLSSFLLACAIGVTPTHIQIYIAMSFCCLCLRDLTFQEIIKQSLKILVVCLGGVVIHLMLVKCSTLLLGVTINTTSYNGFGALKYLNQVDIFDLILNTYVDFYRSLTKSVLFLNAITKYIIVFFVILSVLCLLYVNVKFKRYRYKILFILFCVFIFPLCANCSFFLTAGKISAPHMKFFIIVVYMFGLIVSYYIHFRTNMKFFSYILNFIIVVLSFCNMLWSHSLYNRLDIAAKNTQTEFSLILHEIDEYAFNNGLDNYKVLFVGNLNRNKHFTNDNIGIFLGNKFYDYDISGWSNSNTFVTTYPGTEYVFCQIFLKRQLNRLWETNDVLKQEQVKLMPSYPNKGYILNYKDNLIVKLSD